MTPAKESEVRASFARQALMRTLGVTMTEVTAGRVILQAPVLASAQQQHGVAHAGLTFAMGDSAAGYAAMTLLPGGQDVMTAEMKINLLAPAAGPHLRATGEIVKAGRRLIIVTALVQNIDGDHLKDVALLQGTMVPA